MQLVRNVSPSYPTHAASYPTACGSEKKHALTQLFIQYRLFLRFLRSNLKQLRIPVQRSKWEQMSVGSKYTVHLYIVCVCVWTRDRHCQAVQGRGRSVCRLWEKIIYPNTHTYSSWASVKHLPQKHILSLSHTLFPCCVCERLCRAHVLLSNIK